MKKIKLGETQIKKTLEKDVEQYLCRRVKNIGGKAYKWSSVNVRGVPDRIVVVPGSKRVFFVELKAPGKKLTPLQDKAISHLRGMGQHVLVIDNFEGVDAFVNILGESKQR